MAHQEEGHEYRTLTFDSLTQEFVSEVEMTGLSYEMNLGPASIGESSGTVTLPAMSDPALDYQVLHFAAEDGSPIYVMENGAPVGDPTVAEARRSAAQELIDAVRPVRRQLVVERDGVPLSANLIWAAPGVDQLAVKASDTWSYWMHRVNHAHFSFNNVDTFHVVRTLLAAAAAVPQGNIGLIVPTNNLGTLVSRDYEPWEDVRYGKAIEDLAAADDGFEFYVSPSYDSSGRLVKTLRMARTIGRPYTSTGIVFEVGQNVSVDGFNWPNDWTTVASRLFASGAGSGASTLTATVQESVAGQPVLDDTFALKDETNFTRLVARSQRQLSIVKQAPTLPSLTIDAETDPVLGSYGRGDGCLVRVPPDLVPALPYGIEFATRISGIKVDVADNGTETVTLTFGFPHKRDLDDIVVDLIRRTRILEHQ